MRMPLQDNAVVRANLTEFQISRVLLLHFSQLKPRRLINILGVIGYQKQDGLVVVDFEPEC